MAYVRVALVENRTGTSVTFAITHLEGDPYAVRIRYRETGTLPWSATSLHTQPAVGDKITVDNLTDGRFYDFYPVTVAEDGSEGLPGNLLRACVASADTITRLRDAITSALTYFLPAQNIRYTPTGQPQPHDTDYPLVEVVYRGQRTEQMLNCCRFCVHIFSIALHQEGLSEAARLESLNRHLEEMKRYFEDDLSPFSAVEGYYDTKVAGVEAPLKRHGEPAVSEVSFLLECWIRV